MHFLDANASLGPCFAPREGKFLGVEDLLEEMDLFWIDEAMVYHRLAYEYDSRQGNEAVLKLLASQPRLHPCWVLECQPIARHTYDSVVERGIDSGVRMVRFFWGGPLTRLTVLDLDTIYDLFSSMERHRIPVLINNDAATETAGVELVQVRDVCRRFPQLPVILTSPKVHKDLPIMYKMFEACENFHLETSGIHTTGLIEDISSRFGAHRLIYGTNFPWFGGAQTRIALMYADLKQEEKEAIASGNLRRLLEAVR